MFLLDVLPPYTHTQFSTGRVVGLPTSKMKKTVDDLCRKIMAGDEPVLPEGHAPSNVDEQRHFSGGNPFDNHPYLKRIKIRGGAFAVLMAFHVCGKERQSMTKDQIIRAAQPFCDEAMEGNFNAGRPIGAWKGNQTLINHGLLHIQKARVAYNERAGGLRAMGKNSYTLTREGEQFIEALLKRHPDIQTQIPQRQTTSRGNSSSLSSNFDANNTPSLHNHEHVHDFGIPNEEVDRRRLLDWMSAAAAGSSIVFKVGKDRRKRLHRLCDKLSQSSILRSRGLVLDHLSNGQSRGRAVCITLVQSGVAATAIQTTPKRSPASTQQHNPYTSGTLEPETPEATISVDSPYHLVTGSANYRDHEAAFSGSGRTLTEGESPFKWVRTLGVRAACENAALLRRALFESKQELEKPPPRTACLTNRSPEIAVSTSTTTLPRARAEKEPEVICLIDDSPPVAKGTLHIESSDSKLPAKAKRRLDYDDVLEGLESDDDDDILLSGGPTFNCKREADNSQVAAGVHLAHGVSLCICIDDRERNRNCTPRYLRTELARLVSSGPVATAWPEMVPVAEVAEKSLSYGDFNFLSKSLSSTNSLQESTLPVMVERKRIGDLVQRSASRDHWGQLQRIRDRCSALSVLLLEGDFRTAAAFVSFGAPEEWRKSDHSIDEEHSLLRFIGRAILSSDKIRFVQTKDEQESLRSVVSLGLVSLIASSKQLEQQPKKNPYENGATGDGSQFLSDKLQAGGIPRQIARDLSQELGSFRQLNALYSSVDDQECREQLLAPLLEDACEEDGESSAHAWSRAIHSVHYTTSSDVNGVRLCYQESKQFVTNPAELLARLHSGETPEEAANSSFDANGNDHAAERRRIVEIQIPRHLEGVFESDCDSGETTFYRTKVVATRKNLVLMQTRDERFESDPLLIFLLEGIELVDKLQTALSNTSDCYTASRSLAAQLDSEHCRRPFSIASSSSSRRILLIRGLRPALEQLAKQAGYRQESRFVADLVLAQLMISHDIVVLHAIRKGGDSTIAGHRSSSTTTTTSDQTKLLRALALACFHFQLLTHPTTRKSKNHCCTILSEL